MADIITIEECITRLDAIRHEIVPDSRDHFALSAGIAALYEMENGAPAVNRWIPCSKRLPEDESPVIIAHIDSDGYSLPCIGMFRGNPKKWMTTSAIRIVNVTHWMPLPSTEGLT